MTQEVTPAGTIISLNMVAGIFGGTLLSKIIDTGQGDFQKKDGWRRLIALAMLVVSLLLIFKKALDEFRYSKRSQSDEKSDTDRD